ncbi:unnamed protein product [Cylicocyclus nassatus]|uniref:Uncharacterized protein n=1 Tax=Cylicocyclus nassatus TaxID=53992 RepID=A0AA36DQD9_CYLNA|nr:unnamed protein product [Cylicocyclus nassatus]
MRSRAKDKKVKERRKRSRKSKKGKKSKKEKSLPKIRKRSSKKSEKSKKKSSASKRKRSKDKARAGSRKKLSSPRRIPVERKKRKHWIEEEFLQQEGVQGEKLEHKKEPEAQEKEKRKSNEPVLPVMDTQQATSESKEKKKSDERMTGAVAPESPASLPPVPPPPADDYFRIKPAEGDKRRTDTEGLRDKIYGIKPEKPPERLKSSPPIQGTQEDKSGSKPKVSSQKESVSISITGLPAPAKVPAKKHETPELPTMGDRLRVNIDEILRLGAIMERRNMSTAKKASFEWIALNRTKVKEQPEAFSSHLISAVGDVRLEKSLACDALNVLMYQHTVTPDEYLRLCQHLETVQTITIGLLAQLLRTNTQYYSSLGSQRSDVLNMDAAYR